MILESKVIGVQGEVNKLGGFDPPDVEVPFAEELVPVVMAPAAPVVLDGDITLLLEEVGPEEAGQEAAVGSVTLALYCIYVSTRPYAKLVEPRKGQGYE